MQLQAVKTPEVLMPIYSVFLCLRDYVSPTKYGACRLDEDISSDEFGE
jgi:hypothetical protein